MGSLVDSIIAHPDLARGHRVTNQRMIQEAIGEASRAATPVSVDWSRHPDMPLQSFVRDGWHVVEPGRTLLWNWHIPAICDHLEAVTKGDIRKLIINIPPRHMKSLLVAVFWLAWEWTGMPWTRWIFASYAEKLSKRDSLKTRRLILSPWYQREFGHVFSLTSDQNEKLRYENDRTGYRIATSVGGTSTGEGGDRIVFDDPIKAMDVHSDTKRENVNDWWDQEMSTRANDPDRSAFVGIAQRLHDDDLPGHLLELGGWEHLVLPLEYERSRRFIEVPDINGNIEERPIPPTLRNWSNTSLGFVDPREEPGEILWPERFSRKWVEDEKVQLGSWAASGQLQQRPAPAGGGVFKRVWWRFWEPVGQDLGPVMVRLPDGTHHMAEVVKLPAHFEYELQSWDLAFKDLTTSDFVVGQHWAMLGANDYLLSQIRGKHDFPSTVRQVQRFRKSLANGPVLVEDKANGPAVISTLRDKVTGLVAVPVKKGKLQRAQATLPYVEAGNKVLPHPRLAPWVWDFIEEHASFPNGLNDDQVDAHSQADERMRNIRMTMGQNNWPTSTSYRTL